MVERLFRLAAPPARGQQFVAEIRLEIRFRFNLKLAISNGLIGNSLPLALSS